MVEKVKVAFYWMASCGGCEEAQVDAIVDELSVLNVVEVVFWPVAFDFKKSDLEKMPDKSIDVAFINGGVRLEEHAEMARLLRRKSKIVIAYGACACWGGIPGLANLYSREELLKTKYSEVPTLPETEKGKTPLEKVKTEEGIELRLPRVLPVLTPLDEVIEVDYYIPGCPPTPETTLNAIKQLLTTPPPPKGSILGASARAVCEECPLNKTKPEKLLVKELKRLYKARIDSERCLLAQGVICLGPATRGGCTALCPRVAMPCIGCYGPLEKQIDYGGAVISFIASILDVEPDESVISKIYDEALADIVGIAYKFTLAKSRLRMNIAKIRGGEKL